MLYILYRGGGRCTLIPLVFPIDGHYPFSVTLVYEGLMSSIEEISSIEATFQPYVNSGTIRPIISPQLQACSPSLERYQLSRVLDYSYWV